MNGWNSVHPRETWRINYRLPSVCSSRNINIFLVLYSFHYISSIIGNELTWFFQTWFRPPVPKWHIILTIYPLNYERKSLTARLEVIKYILICQESTGWCPPKSDSPCWTLIVVIDHSITHLLLVTGAADRARHPVWSAGEQVVKIVEIVEIVEIETSGVFRVFLG